MSNKLHTVSCINGIDISMFFVCVVNEFHRNNFDTRVFIRCNHHFPGGPGLANTRVSPFWILLELRVMEVVVTTEGMRCAKLQSNHHHQQTNTQLFTGRMPFLARNQQCQSTEGKQD